MNYKEKHYQSIDEKKGEKRNYKPQNESKNNGENK